MRPKVPTKYRSALNWSQTTRGTCFTANILRISVYWVIQAQAMLRTCLALWIKISFFVPWKNRAVKNPTLYKSKEVSGLQLRSAVEFYLRCKYLDDCVCHAEWVSRLAVFTYLFLGDSIDRHVNAAHLPKLKCVWVILTTKCMGEGRGIVVFLANCLIKFSY